MSPWYAHQPVVISIYLSLKDWSEIYSPLYFAFMVYEHRPWAVKSCTNLCGEGPWPDTMGKYLKLLMIIKRCKKLSNKKKDDFYQPPNYQCRKHIWINIQHTKLMCIALLYSILQQDSTTICVEIKKNLQTLIL